MNMRMKNGMKNGNYRGIQSNKILNPNFEILNKFKIQNTNIAAAVKHTKTYHLDPVH